MTDWLATAERLAERLAADAVWHEGRCSWIAPADDPSGRAGARTYASLSPVPYDGTSGVALVLAETAAATGSAAARRAALGAARHAAARAPELPAELGAALFTGRVGIALALLRVGRLLEEGEPLDAGGRLLAEAGARTPLRSHDLIAGRAGAVVGALEASRLTEDASPPDRATRLGDELLAAASPGDGWSWPSPEISPSADPTGLAHGGAGIGHALLELHAATGEARFRIAADGAAARERDRLDALARPAALHDAEAARRLRPAVGSPFFWCYGAPGVALAGHRAWLLTGDERRRRDAARALAVTARWVRAALGAVRGDFSLCHGLAGNAEVLWDCADACGDEAGAMRALAHEVAAFGVDEHGSRGRPWPCGRPGGECPSLMLGLAGIARFYLRLHDPSLPSVLLPGPASRAALRARGADALAPSGAGGPPLQ